MFARHGGLLRALSSQPDRFSVTLVAVALGLTAIRAPAQSEGRFALGPAITYHSPASRDLESSTSLGATYRLTRARATNGWGPDVSIAWLSADLASPPAGHLGAWVPLAGVSYHRVRQRFRAKFSALTGPAFDKIRVTDAERATLSTQLGVAVTGMNVRRAWVVKPGVVLNYDLGKRVGLVTSVDYMLMRPRLEITTGSASINRTLNADMINVKWGLAIGIF